MLFSPGADHPNFRHGMKDHPAYKSWQGMKDRCHAPKGHEDYKGRGIIVCDRWRSDFLVFWADMGETWFPGATIERRDFNGNYEPSNCCWVPKSEQAKNRRGLVFIDTPWGRMTLAEASRRVGLSPMAFGRRYKLGWRGDRLFSAPVEKGTRITPLTKEYLGRA